MIHAGELTAIIVAVLWTFTALLSEEGSKRIGVSAANVYRMTFAIAIIGVVLAMSGNMHLLSEANFTAWGWLLASGLVGYTFGDFCLYNSYIVIGSRFGQLFMTLAPVAAAISAWVILGEQMSIMAIVGMLLTIVGIGMSILGRDRKADGHKSVGLKLPLRGVMYGIGAAVGQGLGLVLSKTGMQAMPESGFMGSMAGTLMRGIAGWVGFIILLFLRKDQHRMREGLWGTTPLVMLGIAVFGPTLGVSLSLLAATLTDVGIAQTIMSLTPILILIPAYFWQHQKITVREVMGAVVSFAGVALFFI